MRATVRAALNAAPRQELIDQKFARSVHLPHGYSPHAIVRTEGWGERGRIDGRRPPTAAWNDAQTARFPQRGDATVLTRVGQRDAGDAI